MALTRSINGRYFIIFGRELSYLNNAIRKFSSQDSSQSKPLEVYLEEDDNIVSNTVWPDKNLGIFGPKDSRLPMPGNIGLASNIDCNERKLYKQFTDLKRVSSERNDLFTHPLPTERHESILSQISKIEDENLNDELETELTSRIKEYPENGEILECMAQDCPRLVRKEIKDLFTDHDISKGTFTVVTLSQKTINDMTLWNKDVDDEREALSEFFIAAAMNICKSLKDAGYWADFIDPSSGKPFFGPYTNSVLSETNECFRHFGFSIEDLGCCKVIAHRLWGTHTFVGSLFTDVPVENSVLQEILVKYTTWEADESKE